MLAPYFDFMELLDVHTNGSVLILMIGSSTVESMAQLLASKTLISECHRDRARASSFSSVHK